MNREPPKPVSGTARLILFINEQPYLLRFLDPAPEIGYPAWRLTKMKDGQGTETVYDVILREHGAECSCPDFLYRRTNEEKKCKHAAALKAVGLLRRETTQ